MYGAGGIAPAARDSNDGPASADPQRVALAQALMQGNSAIKTAITTKLQEETPTDGAAEPLHEPGFVIATTDDSSPPPVRPLPAQ